MVRIRAFENAAEIASQGGVSAYGQSAAGTARVRGPLHLSTGQEAVATGVCAHLHPADYLTSTHRGHGHTLAKGADLGRMMAELFGKAAGLEHSFWKIAMRPGKPLMAGRLDGVPMLGLPGNPVSAFVTFLTLVRPFVLRLSGVDKVRPKSYLLRADY